LFANKIKSSGGYYLVSDRKKKPTPAAMAFTRWLESLIAEVAEPKSGRA
jgi:hypothetical protein